MQETSTLIKGSCNLEGALSTGTDIRGVVITHPHPLYGGDMHNPVVTTIAQTFAASGYSTLRFNFRGVGASQGKYDEGEGEIDDLLAARDQLAASGVEKIILAGYSFGARVIVNAIESGKIETNSLILISPPAAMMSFSKTTRLPNLKQLITGEFDDIAPPNLIKELHKQWNPDAKLSIIPGCDHFFGGCLKKLAELL